jgi:polysaccharide deacetylase 2 family uncharacterized protein YibQ
MKKTAKETGRRSPRKKSTANTSKKPRKRKKNGYSDAVMAFLLAGVLVAFSACVSLAVIMVRSTLNDTRVVGGTELLPAVSIESDTPQTLYPEQGSTPGESANTAPPASAPSSTPAATNTVQPVRNIPAAVQQSPPERPSVNLGTLVFMIDDAGNNLWELEPFLRLAGPLTIAVLPGLPHSAEAARRIRAAGKEVFLHQPMEAIGAQNPGPGAIYSGMSADEIRSILKRNIAEVGPVAGINNHQGSKITMDREAVQTILAFCAENGLLFLDSRTTADTVVPVMASRLGIKIGERDVFLDNEQDKGSMLRYITGGLSRAQKNGKAVMIGHTWSPELAPLLAEQFPILTRQGYTLKTASDIIR